MTNNTDLLMYSIQTLINRLDKLSIEKDLKSDQGLGEINNSIENMVKSLDNYTDKMNTISDRLDFLENRIEDLKLTNDDLKIAMDDIHYKIMGY